jgi:hypothetical protein
MSRGTVGEGIPDHQSARPQFDQIKAEVLKLVESRDIHTYGEIDPLRASEVSADWKLYCAYMLGEANPMAYQDCPTFLDFAERRRHRQRTVPPAIGQPVSFS